jgi:hypothetical protein
VRPQTSHVTTTGLVVIDLRVKSLSSLATWPPATADRKR